MTPPGAPPGISFRRFRDDDPIPVLTSLLHRAYAPLAARGLRFVATHQSDDVTRNRCTSGECWLAETDDGGPGATSPRIVGTVTWYPPWAESTCEIYRDPTVVHFGQFAVEPTLQGRGLGRALVDHCAARAAAAGYSEFACDTAEPATDLIAMYERWGFRRIGSVRWSEVNYPSVLLSRRLRD